MLLALVGAVFSAGCGGCSGDTTCQSDFNNGTGDQPFKPTTHLSYRSIVTNYYAGALNVVDAYKDRLTTYSFTVGTQPTYMQSSPDGTLTLVNNTGSGTISSFDNRQEAVKATIILQGYTESFVTSQSNKFGFAAVYNYSNGIPTNNNGTIENAPGAIARFNPTDGSLLPFVPLTYVRYLAMDVAEKHLLAFTDMPEPNTAVDPNVNDTAYQAHWVDLTVNTAENLPALSILPLPFGTLSRPVAAFFSTDGNTAYILNCGVECGGSSNTINGTMYPAWITVVNVSNPAAATVTAQWGVQGAQVGYMDLTGNKLYVAGSATKLTDSGGNTVGDGHFTIVDLTAGPTASITIGNGSKRIIRNINGVFWIGAQNCGVQSCITMVDPKTTQTTIAPLSLPKGDATGITLNLNSGEVYTIEGQELQIYDQKANPIISEYNTDVHGQGYDVLYIH